MKDKLIVKREYNPQCPLCDSAEVYTKFTEDDGGVIYHHMRCAECNAEWTNIFWFSSSEREAREDE